MSTDFRLVNVIQEEERLEEVASRDFAFHRSDSFICILLGMALFFLVHLAYIKYRGYKEMKKNKKIEGLRVIYQQALKSEQMPSAPAQSSFNRVTSYSGVRTDIYSIKRVL